MTALDLARASFAPARRYARHSTGSSTGYDSHDVLSAFVDLNWSRYTSGDVITAFADQLLAKLRGAPGVISVSLSSNFPLNNGAPSSQPFLVRGQAPADGLPGPSADVTVASSGYFKTMGIPLLRGRVFADDERDTANVPVMIGQRLAKTYWPDREAVGQQLSFDNGIHWFTIVGIVGDVAQNNLAAGITDEIYLPFFAAPRTSVQLLARTSGDPLSPVPTVRRAVHELDDKQPVSAVPSLDQRRGVRLTEPRVTTMLLVAFGVLSLVITAAGLIGVVSQSVTQRSTEIGIRVALGADARQVLWAVVRGAVLIVAAGIVVGLAVAAATTRIIAGLLYQLGPTDVLTYTAVAGMLFAVAVAACLVPARRALLVSPTEALRGR